MTGTRLDGLEGTNPLGFLAALGVQVAFAHESQQPRLWWSDDVTPRAVVDNRLGIDQIVDRFARHIRDLEREPGTEPMRVRQDAIGKGR